MPVETAIHDRTQRIPPGRLWFGAAGAAVAWAIQGFTCFEIAVQACAGGTGSWGPLSGLGVRLLIGFLSLGFIAVAVAAGFVSYRNWIRLAESRHLKQDEGLGREDYMALVGMFTSLACVVGLIWAGVPPIFFDVCNTIR
jgi:hypothetical protein